MSKFDFFFKIKVSTMKPDVAIKWLHVYAAIATRFQHPVGRPAPVTLATHPSPPLPAASFAVVTTSGRPPARRSHCCRTHGLPSQRLCTTIACNCRRPPSTTAPRHRCWPHLTPLLLARATAEGCPPPPQRETTRATATSHRLILIGPHTLNADSTDHSHK